MSLEIQVAALTAAIENLTKVLTRDSKCSCPEAKQPEAAAVTEPAPVAKTEKKAKKEAPAPKVEEPAPAPEAKTEEPAPKTEEPKAEAPAPKAAKKLTMQDVREVAQKALDAGKLAEVVKLNKEYNLKRISEAPEEKYEEIINRLTAIING